MNDVIEVDNLSSGKRGLDLAKVEYVMGREQERDLRLIYRYDQIQAFCELPAEDRKRYNYERKPSDPVLIQCFWEAHMNYKRALLADDEKLALSWFDRCMEVASKVEAKRFDAMDRLLEWKKQAEADGQQLDAATSAELEALANGR